MNEDPSRAQQCSFTTRETPNETIDIADGDEGDANAEDGKQSTPKVNTERPDLVDDAVKNRSSSMGLQFCSGSTDANGVAGSIAEAEGSAKMIAILLSHVSMRPRILSLWL